MWPEVGPGVDREERARVSVARRFWTPAPAREINHFMALSPIDHWRAPCFVGMPKAMGTKDHTTAACTRHGAVWRLLAIALASVSLLACEAPAVDGQGPGSSKRTKSSKTTTDEVDVEAEGEAVDDDALSDPGLPDRADAPKTDAGTSTSADSGATPAPTPSPSTPTPSLTCGEKTSTRSACYSCCDAEHPSGAATYTKAILAFDACVCLSPGTCASVCGGNYCAGGSPSAACESCLGSAFTCSLIMTGITSQNADYQGLLACDKASACATKP
jgi:hypothetical protein